MTKYNDLFAWREALCASNLPPLTRLVARTLADYMDPRLVCWPSVETLAEKSGLSQRSVFRHLGILRDNGWLKYEYTPRSTRYTGATPSPVPLTVVQVTPDRDAGVPLTEVANTPDRESPELVKNSPLELSKELGRGWNPAPLFDVVAAWQGIPFGQKCPPPMASTIGTALNHLRGIAPDVTPEELQRRIGNIPPDWQAAGPMALVKHWHRLGNAGGGNRRVTAADRTWLLAQTLEAEGR